MSDGRLPSADELSAINRAIVAAIRELCAAEVPVEEARGRLRERFGHWFDVWQSGELLALRQEWDA